jgi:hypothetical protein
MDENPYKAPVEARDPHAPNLNIAKRQPPQALLWLLLFLFPIAHLASLRLGTYGYIPGIAFVCFFIFVLYQWLLGSRT